MNIISLLGFIIATAVLTVGLKLSTDKLAVFLDFPSLFIVIGGTVAATAISFQLDRILLLMKIFISRMLFNKRIKYANTIKEIMKVADSLRKGAGIDDQINNVTDPFLKEGLSMIKDEVMEEQKIVQLMGKRAKKMYYLRMEEANKIKTLGKFPPAFGMMGTTIGMIVLLSNLGGTDAIKMVGPAMGICLITTLYGVIIANLFFIPAAENLIDSTKEDYLKNQIIVEGVKLIVEKVNPIIIAEELNSYLPPSKRVDWKKMIS